MTYKYGTSFARESAAKEWADKINLQYISDYKFVAGTCFAIKAEIVQDMKELGILFDDFVRTKRGVFSLAHAIERFDSLIAEIEEKGYDEKRVIVLNVDDIIMDGQHRACYMMHKYGKDKVLRVLKLCFK